MVEDLFDVDDKGVVHLTVHAQPGAGRTAVVGRHGTALKVKVAAPPDGGRANEAVTKLLAETFGVKAAQVVLASGESSRHKRFRITGVESDDVRRLLEAALNPAALGGPRGS
jgi:uncharacterized protein (TIGR00251 family)